MYTYAYLSALMYTYALPCAIPCAVPPTNLMCIYAHFSALMLICSHLSDARAYEHLFAVICNYAHLFAPIPTYVHISPLIYTYTHPPAPILN